MAETIAGNDQDVVLRADAVALVRADHAGRWACTARGLAAAR